jgi:ABC-type multidrug transport system fused ATPase/permease subunit
MVLAAVLALFAAQQLASLGTNLWIKEWAREYDNLATKPTSTPENKTSPSTEVNAGYYLVAFGMISLAYVLVSFVLDAVTFYGALKASSRIFERLLTKILYAKLLFFDSVPLGQITNRFSKDIEVLDQEISPHSISTFHIFFSLVMLVVLISIVLPAFLPVAVVICLAYYAITIVYTNSSRDLKRIASVERSPLYQQFGESLSGYVSIRAYGRVSSFTAQNHRLIDGFNRPYTLLWAAKEWLAFRVACLSSLISSLTGAFVLWKLGSISPGAAGLVLTYAATFTDDAFFRRLCEQSGDLGGIERAADVIR